MVLIVYSEAGMLITDQQERAVNLRLIGIHEHTQVSTIKSEFYAAFINPEYIFDIKVCYV